MSIYFFVLIIKNKKENKDKLYYYIYKSHLDGYYISENMLKDEDLYCETCYDSDELICSGTKEDIEKEYQDSIAQYNKLLIQYKKENKTNEIENVEYELDCLLYEYKEILNMLAREENNQCE